LNLLKLATTIAASCGNFYLWQPNMKTEVVIYRFVSILLLPVAIMFGLSALAGLVSVIANPAAIIGVLFIGSIVYYIISSTVFLTRGIINGKACKPSLRSSIRITGIITAFFCILMLYLHLASVNEPQLIKVLAAEMIKQPGLPANTTPDVLSQSIKALFTFFMIVSLVLLLHIIMSFRMLKQFHYLFNNGDHPQQ